MLAPPRSPGGDPELLIKEARARQLRRRRFGAAVVAITAAITLGIHAATGSGGGSRTARRQPAVVAADCRLPDLSVRAVDMSNPTGLGRLAFRLTNESAQPCILAGYPLLRFYDRAGTIAFRYRHDGVVKDVVLAPGRSAYTVFSKFRCDIGISRSASRGTLALSGDPGRTATVQGGPSICRPGIPAEGRTVLVYPFEPTLRLASEISLAER